MGVVRSTDAQAISDGKLKSALHHDIAAALPLAQLGRQKRWSEAASTTSFPICAFVLWCSALRFAHLRIFGLHLVSFRDPEVNNMFATMQSCYSSPRAIIRAR